MTGIETASAIRIMLAAAGLTAMLAASVLAYNLGRLAGIVYLIFLGVRAFRGGRPEASPDGPARPVPLGLSARKGLLVGLGNPKMMLFYLAFFPQFIHPGRARLPGPGRLGRHGARLVCCYV